MLPAECQLPDALPAPIRWRAAYPAIIFLVYVTHIGIRSDAEAKQKRAGSESEVTQK